MKNMEINKFNAFSKFNFTTLPSLYFQISNFSLFSAKASPTCQMMNFHTSSVPRRSPRCHYDRLKSRFGFLIHNWLLSSRRECSRRSHRPTGAVLSVLHRASALWMTLKNSLVNSLNFRCCRRGDFRRFCEIVAFLLSPCDRER